MTGAANERKQVYLAKLVKLLQEYSTILVCDVDMVTSNQIQKVRIALRGQAVVLLGKNTLMRKAIRDMEDTSSHVDRLLPYIKKNIGLVFTNAAPVEVRKVLEATRLAAPAREGVIAPCDVTIPKGQTTLAPTETSFMTQLGFSTKINKGAIEILADNHLIKKGNKVTASDSAVLQKLDIKPFRYGLEIQQIFSDGMVYSPSVLDISDDDLVKALGSAVATIAAIGLAVGFPTLASVPHSIIGAFRNVVAVALETDYDLPAATKMKEMLANPTAFAAAAAPTTASAGPAKHEEKKEEKEEEEEDMGFGLFD